MPSRRDFLTTLASGLGAAGLAAAAVAPLRAAAAASSAAGAVGQAEIQTALNAPLGLQLWSLRQALPKDLAGTLAQIRAMGFREVEGAGLWKHTVTDLRAALDKAGLRCQSAHMNFTRLRDDMPGAIAEAKAVGATWIVCPWIDHDDKKGFSREDALKSADVFNRAAKAAKADGLQFAYHLHGYEFVPSTEGTLFETLMGATDASLVQLQVDVFHAFLGGADPAALIDRYASRVSSLHLKDLKKGFPVKAGTAVAPAEADVPVGTGQLDMPAVLRAAMKAKPAIYYLEDESAQPLANIPKSVAWLKAFRNRP